MEEKQILSELRNRNASFQRTGGICIGGCARCWRRERLRRRFYCFLSWNAAALISCTVPEYLLRYIAVPTLINATLVLGLPAADQYPALG